MASMAGSLSVYVHGTGLAIDVDAGMVGRDAGHGFDRDRVGQRRIETHVAREAALDGVTDAEDDQAKGERNPDAEAPGTG
ncbi:hypothetical protein GCM10008171_02170 [Methylopila jiangsuensis]|uniref:Uncharacterized protein n=1 Tax=Methylopila jiangsuensis TaxID=586230 RepID=A0A9W6N1J6_9HYPH|nr:hypothetical protein GCM10008171_02170 [Methylopila jiangsuensis]